MDRYTILLALTKSGSLYAGVPDIDGAGYRIRRYRPHGKLQARELAFSGAICSVTTSDPSTDPEPETIVHCAGEVFQIRSDTFGAPELGLRMLAGLTDSTHLEVTSSIVWTGRMPVDRQWVLDSIFRAYRNEDAAWRALLQEQPFEVGLEGIRDDSSGLTATLIRDFYDNWLASKAERRDRFGAYQRQGDIRPRSLLVSNEDLERELRAAVGDDFQEVPLGPGTIVARIRVPGSPRRPYSLRPLALADELREPCAAALDRYSVNLANRLLLLEKSAAEAPIDPAFEKKAA